MPPNRSSLVQISDALSSLDVASIVDTKQSAFLPLTHPQEEAKHREGQAEEDEYICNPNPNASYWDWPEEEEQAKKNDAIETILKEEEVRKILSVAHMEENLKKAAASLADNEVSTPESDSDDYWNMPSEPDQAVEESINVAQHVKDASHPKASYWDWPSESQTDKAALIKGILRQEESRRMVSCERIQENLVASGRDAASQTDSQHDAYWNWESAHVAPHVGDETHPRNSYWDWPSEPSSKQQVIGKILQEERIRQMLLSTQPKVEETSTPMVSAGVDSSASYWEW